MRQGLRGELPRRPSAFKFGCGWLGDRVTGSVVRGLREDVPWPWECWFEAQRGGTGEELGRLPGLDDGETW